MNEYPLSKQQRLIYDMAEAMGDASAAIVGRASFEGNVEEARQREAARKLIDRYRILTARILLREGNPVQVFDRDPDALIHFLDFQDDGQAEAFSSAEVRHGPMALN